MANYVATVFTTEDASYDAVMASLETQLETIDDATPIATIDLVFKEDSDTFVGTIISGFSLASATISGTVDVDPVANTIGLSTNAAQLPDGHNVTVDNAIGVSAVNIQDGGNIITVDGTVTANPASGTIDTVTSVTAIANALPAGTNAIGKLAANTGVDIGDVDVTSSALPTGAATSAKQLADGHNVTEDSPALVGPAAIVVDSSAHVAINLVAGANQVLVASAANKQIWVYGYQFTVNAAGTVSFQDEDDAAISGIMPFATNGGASVSPSGNFAMPIWKLATDKDLEVDIVTSELDGWLTYAIMSV